MALERKSPPNMIGVVGDLQRRYPDVFRAAHAGYRPGVRSERGELFVWLLAWELYSKHDARWGANGKRGNSNDPSQDAINWKMSDTERVVIDFIGAAGGPSPYPAWTVNAPHGESKGAWLKPHAISQAEINRIMGTGRTPTPETPPAPSFNFTLKAYPRYDRWPPSDGWLEVAANNILATAQRLKRTVTLESIGKALFHALRTPGDVAKVIEWSLKNDVKKGYPAGKPVKPLSATEKQIKQYATRSSQLIREYRPWVIRGGRVEKKAGAWIVSGGDLALKWSIPSFANFLEIFLQGKSEKDVAAFITGHAEHANFRKWQRGEHPRQR